MAADTASSLWKKRIHFPIGPVGVCILPAGDRMGYPTTGGVRWFLGLLRPPEPSGRRIRIREARSRQNRSGRHFANDLERETLSQV